MFIFLVRKVLKNRFFKKGLIAVLVAGLLLALFLFDGKSLLFPKSEPVVVASDNPHRVISVEDFVVGKAKKINKAFAYESYHDFKYKLDDSPTFVKAKESDNKIMKGIRFVGKVYFGKESKLLLTSFYQIGYDISKLTKKEVYFDKETGILHVYVDKFEIFYKPLFEIAAVDDVIGKFRLPYTAQQLLDTFNDAVEYGYNEAINDPEIEKEATEFIEESIKDRFSNSKEIDGKIKKVEVEFGGEYVKVERDILNKKSEENKQSQE